MNTAIPRKTRPRRSLHPLVGLRLEFWNGAGWECGHPEHRNMSEATWRELKPKVRRWSCPWRVIASRVEAKSRKQPNAKDEERT
jgi:hypothetical protein